MNALTGGPPQTSPELSDPRPHAIVVGAGVGGLAAAIRLGARGWRVSVLDRLGAPGGRASEFRQDGYTFDAGPTIVTAPHVFQELWALCGKNFSDDIELRSLSPFYRIRFDDGSHFDCSADPEAMRAEIARLAPDDVAGYARFMAASEAIFRIGFLQFSDVPFSSWWDMAKQAPNLLTLQSWRTVHSLVARYFKDERIRTVFSFHPLLIGGNPFTTTSVYALISYLEKTWGVHYPMGGIGRIVAGMARLIAGQGGTIACDTDVAEITVERGRASGVRLASGETIPADIVISNADSAHTYRTLIPGKRRRRWTDRKLDRARYSMSLFVWYFGTNRRFEDVPHHTILLGPRYRGLLDDIFNRHRLADDFSLYLHRPTATDPSLAPAGCDSFYVLSPVPNLIGGATDWAERAEPYRRAIQRRLEERLLPGLGDAIVTSKMVTPIDFRDRLLSPHGAAFGLEPILMQSAWFRPHNLSEEVDGLYLVGAGTHPGAGLPSVVSSAKILDRLVPHANAFVRR